MIPQHFPVTAHTNHVGPDSTFVVIQGHKEHGAQYIPLALQKGATTIVIEESCSLLPSTQELIAQHHAEIIYVSNARKALAELAAHNLNYPAKKLKFIGITGTKGKTTTSFLTEHILKTAGYKTALLSTVHNKILDTIVPTQLTTQQPDYLHVFFDQCVQQGVEWVVMEVAAQALTLHRTHGIEFDCAIFTNFSQEHAEFYASMDEYFEAKKLLLKQCKQNATIIINSDDHALNAFQLPDAINMSMKNLNAFLYGRIKQNSLEHGLTLDLPKQHVTLVCPALCGEFNGYNILAAYALGSKLSLTAAIIKQALQNFNGVPGRLDRYNLSNGATVFIDYAHNPSSHYALLTTMRSMTEHLIVVFGCGGDRDRTKRPVMGEHASKIADLVILTTDNPRSEDPKTIIQDIVAGIQDEYTLKIKVELDRKEAIHQAYNASKSGSIILLLGKGPDEYQEIQGVKYPFSEKLIIKQLIER